MNINRNNTLSLRSEKILWLANEIFTAFPDEVTGLKFYVLDCGCIYYQRVFPDGSLDAKTGIYRDSENGACDICMRQEKAWKDRVVDGSVVHNNTFAFRQIEL